MSRISSLNHPSAGTSAALLGEEGRSASDSAQSEMTISQMSRLFGVSLRTLRFYEDRGLIKPRREGNARFYRGADRVRMEMILKGKKLGFTLTEIQDLIGGKGATETPDLEDQLNAQQIVTQIGHLKISKCIRAQQPAESLFCRDIAPTASVGRQHKGARDGGGVLPRCFPTRGPELEIDQGHCRPSCPARRQNRGNLLG
jgi:DNA-binding transcriptional MerR regulator